MNKEIIYQVLPRFWGRGKFSSWDGSAIRRVRSLGVSCVWFTGVIRHARGEAFVKGDPGSPYSISDYFDVNPYLADNEQLRMNEFDDLISRCHAAGLKVIIDFVPNHVACNYSDRFGGIPVLDHCDYDWTDTLKIDYSNPLTAGAMTRVLEFWAGRGVDGFRCDMVELVPREFFAYAFERVRLKAPGTLFIGEAYDRSNYAPLLSAGFDLLYDKSGFYDTVRSIMTEGTTARALTWNWQNLGALQPRMLNFLENHDEQRAASRFFLGRADRSYAALAYGALFNTASFMVYAGGETGEDAAGSCDGRTSIFNWTSLKSSDTGVLKRYEEVLKLASTPLFSKGANWDLAYCNESSEGFNPDRHAAFLRYDSRKAALVVCNFSDSRSDMEIRFPEEFGGGGIKLGVEACDYTIIKFSTNKCFKQ